MPNFAATRALEKRKKRYRELRCLFLGPAELCGPSVVQARGSSGASKHMAARQGNDFSSGRSERRAAEWGKKKKSKEGGGGAVEQLKEGV